MNRYRKGANVERQAVTDHIKKGAIFAGRFAGSKCKGKIKIDVVALYLCPNEFISGSIAEGVLMLEQYKKGKGSYKKDKLKFKCIYLPNYVKVNRKFIQVK